MSRTNSLARAQGPRGQGQSDLRCVMSLGAQEVRRGPFGRLRLISAMGLQRDKSVRRVIGERSNEQAGERTSFHRPPAGELHRIVRPAACIKS